MARSTTGSRPTASTRDRFTFARIGAGLSGAIALLYLLIYAGVLSVGRAEAGDLGALGVAGIVFILIAGLLWFKPSRLLWTAVAVFQIPLMAMYVAIAPERDPGFEVWGVTIRVLSVALLAVMIAQLVAARRQRTAG